MEQRQRRRARRHAAQRTDAEHERVEASHSILRQRRGPQRPRVDPQAAQHVVGAIGPIPPIGDPNAGRGRQADAAYIVFAIGRAETVLSPMHNTPFTDMNDSEGAVQEAGYAAFESAERMLELLAGLVSAVRIDSDRVRRNIDASCITITELADTLVREEGLSFRQAHEIAAHVGRHVVAAATNLRADGYAPFRIAFETATGRAPGLDAAEFARAVSPERFVAVRDRFGGPAPAALDAAFERYAQALDAQRAAALARTARETQATAELDAAFAALSEA